MNYSWENETHRHVKQRKTPQQRHHSDNYDRSLMVVSDDDEFSFVGAQHTFPIVAGNGEIDSFVGSSSPCTSSFVLSDTIQETHQVTPRLRSSEDVVNAARSTTTNGRKEIGSKKGLPFCPPFSHLTDARKTNFTIQSRDHRAQDSPSKLVDEYTVKCDRYNPAASPTAEHPPFGAARVVLGNESIRRHDFNACRTSMKPEDTPNRGIHTNPVDLNLRGNPHKIPDYLGGNAKSFTCHNISNIRSDDISDGISNDISNDRRSHPIRLKKKTSALTNTKLDYSHNPLSISSNNNNNNNNTAKMPSKVSSCLPRQRSRAIAIKRSRPGDFIDASDSRSTFVETEARKCDTEIYDYATWRMYNRIIDHRRKNLLRSQLQEDLQGQSHGCPSTKNTKSSISNGSSGASSSVEYIGQGVVHPSSTIHGRRYYVHQSAPYPVDDYISEDEDEIFDLEL